MKYSTLKEIAVSNDIVSVFGGLNKNISTVKDGEFYDMKNLTSSFYPALSPRGKRGKYNYPGNTNATHKINGIYAKGSLCYVDNTDLFINNEKVLGITLEDSKKTFASLGTYLIILPDRIYVNTIDTTDHGTLNRSWYITGGVSLRQCDSDGNDYNITSKSDTEPTDPSDKECFIDTSGDKSVLKMYSEEQDKWKEVTDVCLKLTCSGTQTDFEEGDEVTFSGFNLSAQPLFKVLAYGKHIIRKIYVTDSENTAIIMDGFMDSIIVPIQTTPVRMISLMPILDFVIESGNRLWGCRYGLDNDGNFVNEIYASKLGDFKKWSSFKGTSMDSYRASCGSDGEFTGAIVHLGYPLFFKENFIHKIYGNYPSNYQIQTTQCRGVMKGAAGSLTLANELLMYKSRSGVCVFDGSLPKEISYALGSDKFTLVDEQENPLWNGAVGGFFRDKYYLSMKSETDSKWYLFAYDTNYGLWHKEDETRADSFCSLGNELYFVDHETKEIRTMYGSGISDTEPVEWMAESGAIGVTMKQDRYTVSLLNKKYISKLLLRMSLNIGTTVRLYIQYDSMGEWEHISTVVGTTLQSFSLPIKARRCDHFRLRIEGVGEAKIFVMAKTIEQGSDE